MIGKFDSAVDAVAYEVSLSGCDDEAGSSTEGPYWAGILRGFTVDGPLADLSATARLDNGLTAADIEFMRHHPAGCILTEDGQGFVSVEWFRTPEDRESRWGMILRDIETETET